MAASEKYSKFSKSRKSNFKGKKGAVNVYEWSGYRTYDPVDGYTEEFTVYTTSPVLQAGVTLYTGFDLTQFYFNFYGDTFYRDNKVYTDSGDNQTVKGEYNVLTSDYDIYGGCGSSTSVDTYFVGNNAQYFQNNVAYSTWWDDDINRLLSQTFYYDPNGTGFATTIVTTDVTGLASETSCST